MNYTYHFFAMWQELKIGQMDGLMEAVRMVDLDLLNELRTHVATTNGVDVRRVHIQSLTLVGTFPDK